MRSIHSSSRLFALVAACCASWACSTTGGGGGGGLLINGTGGPAGSPCTVDATQAGATACSGQVVVTCDPTQAQWKQVTDCLAASLVCQENKGADGKTVAACKAPATGVDAGGGIDTGSAAGSDVGAVKDGAAGSDVGGGGLDGGGTGADSKIQDGVVAVDIVGADSSVKDGTTSGDAQPPKDTTLSDIKDGGSQDIQPGTQDCCTAGKNPSCNNPDIAACVCAQDAYCCESAWDGQCVGEVNEFKCGACAIPDAGATDSSGTDSVKIDAGPMDVQAGTQTCCEVAKTPSCKDVSIAKCVCAQDGFCCSSAWDNLCVGEVNKYGCGVCAVPDAGPTDGGMADAGSSDASPPDAWNGDVPVSSSDCCVASATPGCATKSVAACVCAKDSYCCTNKWDSICVGEVNSQKCGTCASSGGDAGSFKD